MAVLTNKVLNDFYLCFRTDVEALRKPHSGLNGRLNSLNNKLPSSTFSSDDESLLMHEKLDNFLSNEDCYNEHLSKISDSSFYKELALEEKKRLLEIFNIFFYAQYQVLPTHWILIAPNKSFLMNSTASYDTFLPPSPQPTFEGFSLESGTNGDLGKCALICLLSLVTGFTFLALFYILNRVTNSIERLIYDENWLKASITLASILAGAAAGAVLGFYLVAPLVMYFGYIVLGLANPMSLAIIGVVLTTFLLTALFCLIANGIQNFVFEKTNPEALDPKDARRFELNETELQILQEKGFDTEVVTCALIALRNDMDVECLPALLSRCLSSTPRMQIIKNALNTVRALKNGTYDLSKPLITTHMTFHLAASDKKGNEYSPPTPSFVN